MRRGGGTSVWRLSGTVARCFFNLPYARYVLPVPGRRVIVRMMSFAALAWGGWRANGLGTAVCGVSGAGGPRRRLAAAVASGLAGVTAIAGWVAWLALWSAIGLDIVPALTFFGFAGLMLLLGWRAACVGKAKSKLGKLTCAVDAPTHALTARPSRRVEVHMVASEERGAGHALLISVAVEADRNGWALVLDAANDRLAAYYRGLGFEATGPPADMPFGERVTRMVRAPSAVLERDARDSAALTTSRNVVRSPSPVRR
jgi:hypothetical protein